MMFYDVYYVKLMIDQTASSRHAACYKTDYMPVAYAGKHQHAPVWTRLPHTYNQPPRQKPCGKADPVNLSPYRGTT